MPFKIVRNDITKMNTEAIVNTANEDPVVGPGCDSAVYKAAGYEELLNYRKEKIGAVPEGEAFLTPGFQLPASYIIHAVSPLYLKGDPSVEEKLRLCYKNSLELAKKHEIRSVAFPLISTGSFGFPKEEGMRIAVDEIHAFLLKNDMLIYLVVFDDTAVSLGEKIYPDLEAYIDRNYVEAANAEEYRFEETGRLYSERELKQAYYESGKIPDSLPGEKRSGISDARAGKRAGRRKLQASFFQKRETFIEEEATCFEEAREIPAPSMGAAAQPFLDFEEEHESKLEERMGHLSDTFSQYLLYLIKEKKMENAEVYKRAIVDKKTFSKLKNNEDYHPQKITALCLCVGAKLNLDETKDLLARAGYALSPCDKTDIIFSYFIENEIYDMIELDIQLEEHGLPCIIA